jgi:hypothetical protein
VTAPAARAFSSSVAGDLRYTLVVFDRGSLTLARWQGSSLQLHWSFPLGVALFTAWMGLAPGAWIGFLVLSMVHLLGHQLLAAACRLDIEASVLHFLGGDVRPRAGTVTTPMRRAVVGWGGLLAQAILLGVVELAVAMRGWPSTAFFAEACRALVWSNMALLALHLLPLPGTDSWETWRLAFRRRGRAVVVMAPPARPQMAAPKPTAARAVVAQRPAPRATPSQPFAAQRGSSASGPHATASVVYDSDVRLPRETEEYLRAVLERARKNSQPKN